LANTFKIDLKELMLVYIEMKENQKNLSKLAKSGNRAQNRFRSKWVPKLTQNRLKPVRSCYNWAKVGKLATSVKWTKINDVS